MTSDPVIVGRPPAPVGTPSVVCLHAHPDDEAMLSGELLAKAGAVGLRTVVVYGTWGDAGETVHDLGGETLGQRRMREARAACAQLGVDRVEGLGHLDSGMAGTATNAAPAAFSNRPTALLVDELVALLAGEQVLAVVGYDANGTYGHPDHLQVHRCAHALAPRVGARWLIDATFNQDHLLRLPPAGGHHDPAKATPEAEITHFVQGHPWFRAKMEAIKQHGSQTRGGQPTMGGAPPRPRRTIEEWRARFGTEWFVVRPLGAAQDLGLLAEVLEPIDHWPGPLTRPDPSPRTGAP